MSYVISFLLSTVSRHPRAKEFRCLWSEGERNTANELRMEKLAHSRRHGSCRNFSTVQLHPASEGGMAGYGEIS